MMGYETFVGDIMNGAPNIAIPLSDLVLFMLLVSCAAIMAWHRAVLLLCYGFLVNWVFVRNLQILSFNRVGVVTVSIFAVFGVLGLCLTCYQFLTSSSKR